MAIQDEIVAQQIIPQYVKRPMGRKEFTLNLNTRYRLYVRVNDGEYVEQLDYTPTQAVQAGNKLVGQLRLIIDEQPIQE